mgnify:CR=1 FL=1
MRVVVVTIVEICCNMLLHRTRKTRTIQVKIPAGIDDGQTISLRGEGNGGFNGGPAGDLIVEVRVKNHQLFDRRGYDIYCDVPITVAEATLGAEIEVPTLDGKTAFSIPEGTQTGKEFVLSGKGIPYVSNPNRRGNHRFFVVVETPTKLTKEQKELLRKLDDSLDNKSSPKRKKFFDMLKDLFD